MSRVVKLPINIPSGVNVELTDSLVTVKSHKGALSLDLTKEVSVVHENDQIKISPISKDSRSIAMWGTTRSRINNMVKGVSSGFSRQLEVRGVGYKAILTNKILTLSLGFSHEIKIVIPSDVDVKVEKQTQIEISGIDIQKVGKIASEIRSLRKPEPYKGKGVRYVGEYVRTKEGKKK
jgi:large subunit ribosomal protein L6